MQVSDYQKYEMLRMKAASIVRELTEGMRLEELKMLAANVDGAIRHVEANRRLREGGNA